MGAMRVRLQAATADIHEALHHAEPFARIAAGQMDRAGYASLLAMLHRYHAGLSGLCTQGASRLGAPELAVAHGARLTALQNDLALFAHVPPAAAAHADGDDDFAVGCLYTVQGSTLGGKVIHRQLAALLPQAMGRSFFAGNAEDGAQWRLFCDRLEAEADSLDFSRVEEGARHAFGHFAGLLREPVLA